MTKYIHEINTDNILKPDFSDDLIITRSNIIKSTVNYSTFNSDVTICVQAYNRIENTKQCIDSILKYTKDINFDLLLIDSGSNDGTFEFFKSIQYDKVRIIRLTKNINALFPSLFVNIDWVSKYIVSVANDIIVTPNWLSNMIKIAESDPKIGIVTPMSSNSSNYQNLNIDFANLEEMQKKAAIFNISDSTKWQERLRIITLGTLYKKECIISNGFPINDIGFCHDFGDDDIAFQARRNGYKVIVAGDTWIHHNHDLTTRSNENIINSLKYGRNNFIDKYYGLDAWNDVNNFIFCFLPYVTDVKNDIPKILGIDVKCGTPILEIKNKLRKYYKFDCECYSFTKDAKYFLDLQTICGANNVFSGSVSSIHNCFRRDYYDYIIIDNPINSYENPYVFLNDVYDLLNNGGHLFIKLKNVHDIIGLMYSIGYTNLLNDTNYYSISIDDFYNRLKKLNYNVRVVNPIAHSSEILTKANIDYISAVFENLKIQNAEETISRLFTNEYAIEIIKE